MRQQTACFQESGTIKAWIELERFNPPDQRIGGFPLGLIAGS
jgi:hypothetical protein